MIRLNIDRRRCYPPIDYRCEHGRFSVYASSVTISNPNSFSSCETEINPGIRSSKSTHLNELDVTKAIGDIYFAKK
jgi:hypothetical protein